MERIYLFTSASHLADFSNLTLGKETQNILIYGPD